MKRILISGGIGLLLWTFICTDLFADSPASVPVRIQAVRLVQSVIVDGRLSESVWQNGNGFSDLIQRDPVEGKNPSERTEIHVAYDDQAIYVAARLYDSSPDSIVAQMGRRDSDVEADYFCLYVDPYLDRRSGYYFTINAAGCIGDGILMNDEWDDSNWDGVWEGRAARDDQGWTAELRVPYSQLRFHKREEYEWGINFKRVIHRKHETLYLTYQPKNGSGFVSRFSTLVGIRNIDPSRKMEWTPYVRTKAEWIHALPGDPFNDGSRVVPDFGTDLKFGLSNNLTLDATFNPDFGQVEVDPAVVNLSDVETFYPEKRLFFMEGSSLFNFGVGGSTMYLSLDWPSPDFFYSRRIGRPPQGGVPDADFVQTPEGTRILGAAKVTGKLKGDWNVGMLHSLTNREYTNLSLEEDRFKQEVEPYTYYGVFRTQKIFHDSRQGLGFMSTYTQRFFDEPALRDQLNASSLSLGVDGWNFLDSNHNWVISGWAGMSRVSGSEPRMLGLQNNPQHYFQRPDADHVEIDSSMTGMTGFAGRFMVNNQKGNWLFNAAVGFIDPKFDVNDLGFMSRSDLINTHLIALRRWTQPGKLFRYAELHGAIFANQDFSGNCTAAGLFHFGILQTLNYISFNWYTIYSPETLNSMRTRGGPLTLNPAGWSGNLNVSSDSRKPIVLGVSGGVSASDADQGWNAALNLYYKPAPNLNLTVGPQIVRSRTQAQYVTAVEDPTATRTYGSRYLFADLDLTILSASIRLNWTFTPTLSLQLYAQPLISTGDYGKFKELKKPRTYDFLTYGKSGSTYSEETGLADPDGNGPAPPIQLGDYDFTLRSLRGNAVLRWEFRPGSTLYFVWTQDRAGWDDTSSVQWNDAWDKLWGLEADNIFMVKATYWFNL